jgi:hypothetical protein
VPGTEFSVTLPLSLENPTQQAVAARVVKLPFVEKSAQ